jgi:hypothetical protein
MEVDWRRSPVRRMWSLARLARSIGIVSLAGAAAGLIAGGLGSRIAMRISALQTGTACRALITDNGNQCGDITPGGTGFLLLFGALGFGCSSGLAFLAVRPAIDRLGRWRGLGFGLLLLAIFGFSIITADNPDFRRFGPAGLNVAMFATIFVVFGLLVAPLYDWLDLRVPRLPPDRTLKIPTLAAYAAVGLAAVFGILMLPLAVSVLGWVPAILYALVLSVGGVRTLIRRSQASEKRGAATAVSPMGQRLQLAVLAMPLVVGTFLTVRSILGIF